MALQPRLQQQAAIDGVLREFEVADRATVVMPCGTGKTLVGEVIAAEMTERMTVVPPSVGTRRPWIFT